MLFRSVDKVQHHAKYALRYFTVSQCVRLAAYPIPVLCLLLMIGFLLTMRRISLAISYLDLSVMYVGVDGDDDLIRRNSHFLLMEYSTDGPPLVAVISFSYLG